MNDAKPSHLQYNEAIVHHLRLMKLFLQGAFLVLHLVVDGTNILNILSYLVFLLF